jgi:hypothetical protein
MYRCTVEEYYNGDNPRKHPCEDCGKPAETMQASTTGKEITCSYRCLECNVVHLKKTLLSSMEVIREGLTKKAPGSKIYCMLEKALLHAEEAYKKLITDFPK